MPRSRLPPERRNNSRKPSTISICASTSANQSFASSEAAEFRAVRASASPGNGLAAKYSGYPGINYFSDVYFDSHRSVALVYMLNWCANLCGQGEWVYLEKQNGHWVKRSGQEAITSGAKPF